MKRRPPRLSTARARELRRNASDAEQRMWGLLKEVFPDARFRRQVPIRNYIADFASHREKVVIEIDGGQHSAERDMVRSQTIEAEGYRVIRFWNNEVLENGEGCMITLDQFLGRAHPHPTAASQQADKPAYPSPIEGEEDSEFRVSGKGEHAPSAEFSLIKTLRRLAHHPGARNLDDDCAVIEFGGEALVLTHDMMAEGVHFLSEQDAADVAWKLVASNMSDLAAKGAEPVGVLVGYMLGRDDARFLAGLEEALAHFGAPLLGGDTVSSTGAQALGLTAIGRATHRPVPSRSGAQEGEALYLTGPVGAAMMGFEALRTGSGDSLAYRRPLALLAEGQALAPLVTAMMDVSDGLLLDASRIARASGVTLAIDAGAVPIAAPESRRGDALRWGDDYQLLFTAPPGVVLPVPVHPIGKALAKAPSPILLDGAPLSETDGLGYQHS